MFTVGSLFAGIGGFDLGFERAGFRVLWQVEIDPFCRRVLAKHWPDAKRHDDVTTFPPPGTEPDEWGVDVVCGGFPCQDISFAGKGTGIKDGTRSGLWAEYARIVRVLRPRVVVVENVPALLVRGLGPVLGDLAACGYDAEWDCLPAAAFGADHIRDRVFIVAYPAGDRGGFFDGPAAIAYHRDWPNRDLWGQERDRGIGAAERRRVDSLRRAGQCGVRPVVDGVPAELRDYRGYGNSVVPQVAEYIARRVHCLLTPGRATDH